MTKIISLYDNGSVSICKEREFKYSKKIDTILIPVQMEGLLDGYIPVHANKYMDFDTAELEVKISSILDDDDDEYSEVSNFSMKKITTASLIEFYNYLHSFHKMNYMNSLLESGANGGFIYRLEVVEVYIKLFKKNKCIYEYYYDIFDNDDKSFNIESLDVYHFIYDYNKGQYLKINTKTNTWEYSGSKKSKNVNVICGQLLLYSSVFIFGKVPKIIPSPYSIKIITVDDSTSQHNNKKLYSSEREVFEEYVYDMCEVYGEYGIEYSNSHIILYEIMVYYHYMLMVFEIVYRTFIDDLNVVIQIYNPSFSNNTIYDRNNINEFFRGVIK